MSSLRKGLVLSLSAVLLAATPLQAANCSWVVASGYVDNAGNWDPAHVPGSVANDTVVINNNGLAIADATHVFETTFPFAANATEYSFVVGDTGSGALQQNGGTVNASHGLVLGNAAGSYGYYGLSGGELDFGAGGYVGLFPLAIGRGGAGVCSQTGGVMKGDLPYWVVGLDAGGNGQLSVTGGTFSPATAGSLPVVLVGWGGNGEVNIGGTGDINLNNGVLFLSQGGGTGVLNLGDVKSSMGGAGGVNGGGGILRATEVFGYGSASFNGDALATTNFHGATVQVTSSTPPPPYVAGGPNGGFFNMNGGKAYVYSEGAVFDTNGFNAAVNSGLDAPAGSGVSGIAITAGGGGFIGEPVLTITDTGGTGSGATARAIVDLDPTSSTFRQVTKIVVTNPGINYTGPVTVGFTGGGPAAVLPTIGTTSVAENVSGGLTKKGTGVLSLNANSSYTGPTTIEAGTLALNAITMASSGITVKSGGTLAGNSANFIPIPTTTVESGGSIAPGTTGLFFQINELRLQNNSSLNFTFDAYGNPDPIEVTYNVSPTAGSTLPITVNVGANIPGTLPPTTQLLSVYGTLDSNINFTLPGGKALLDSNDGKQAAAALDVHSGPGGYVNLVAGGTLVDIVPAWNTFGGGNWNDNNKWGMAPNTTPPNPHPDGGDKRGMFTNTLGAGEIKVNLNISPTLSSMIFDSPSGESYNIVPTASANVIKLDSNIAQNWHITVLGGTHTVAADIQMAAGTVQSVIRLVDTAHLTLSGVLSDKTTATGVDFNGNLNAVASTGVLTLSGNNKYTGPTTVKNGILEVKSIANVIAANSLGKSGSAPANLVLDNSTLHYIGTTAATTDRGFTVKGTSTVLLDGNAGFTGQILADGTSSLTVTGPGTLTLGYTGAETNALETLQVVNGALTIDANSKLQVNAIGQIGCNSSAGDLTINDGGVLTSPSGNRFEIAHIGSSHVVLSGTSTTSPAKLSIGGTAWIGVSLPGEAPSTALIELSGTAEMHLGTTGPDVNAHLGLGADTTFTLTMKDDSKFTCGIVAPPEDTRGWFDLGALASTANLTLSDNASLTIPNSHVALINGSITLNGAATVTSAKYVYAAVDPTDVAAITLNGGTFTAPYFFTSSQGTINFNGGALKASAASDDFIRGETFAVNVQANGAKIDTNGFDVTVAHVLQHDPALGAIDGGLMKLGAGTLTFTMPNTYTGDTTVNEGTLNVVDLNTPAATVSVKGDSILNAASITADTLSIGGAPAAAVPEPGTLMLLALAALVSIGMAWSKRK